MNSLVSQKNQQQEADGEKPCSKSSLCGYVGKGKVRRRRVVVTHCLSLQETWGRKEGEG